MSLNSVMPLSWLPLISDYTREAEKPAAATAVSVGVYSLASIWMYVIGMGAAIFTGETDIAQILLKAGLSVAALVIVVFSTVTTTFLDAFSAGVSSETISKKLRGKPAAIAVTVIGTAAAMGVVRGQRSVRRRVILPTPAHQLGHGGAALTDGGGHAVAGGVAGAHNDHIPARGGGDFRGLPELSPLHGGLKILRAVADAGYTGCVEAQRPGQPRAAAEDHGVILVQEAFRDLRVGGVHAGDKGHALVGHQFDAAADDGFRQLHGAVFGLFHQQIAAGAHIHGGVGDNLSRMASIGGLVTWANSSLK